MVIAVDLDKNHDADDYAIYARLSSAQQEDGMSLETQIERCKEKAGELGHTKEPRFIWRETRTGIIIERPILDEARKAAANGQISALFVFSPDRLSRDPLHSVMLIREFADLGVDLHFVIGVSDSSPEGQLLAFVNGYAGLKEHAMIRERTMRGRDAAAKAGRMPQGMGHGLFGYDYRRGDYFRTINEDEARVVRLAFKWADQGWTGYRILTTLNELNIPTKTGKRWGTKTIKKLLTNRSYIGENFYRGVRIYDFSPPIIDEELFERVQQRLVLQEARYAKHGSRKCLVTGFVSCLTCDSPVTGTDVRYYQCIRARSVRGIPKSCWEPSLRRDRLEAAAWASVVEAIRDPGVLIAELGERLRAEGGSDVMQTNIEKLHREVASLWGQLQELHDLRLNGQIDREALDQRLKSTIKHCRDKEAELDALEKRSEMLSDTENGDQGIKELCRTWSERLDDLDFEEKRTTLEVFGVRIKVSKGKPLAGLSAIQAA